MYNNRKQRYEIKNVIGPDEYHLYVDNNFYTNLFAQWNIKKADFYDVSEYPLTLPRIVIPMGGGVETFLKFLKAQTDLKPLIKKE